jgi:hypothetical protein
MISEGSWILKNNLKQTAAIGYPRMKVFANFFRHLTPTFSTSLASRAAVSLQQQLGCSGRAAPGASNYSLCFSRSTASVVPQPPGVPCSISFSIWMGLRLPRSTARSRTRTRVQDGKANTPLQILGHFPDSATSLNQSSADSRTPSGHCISLTLSMNVMKLFLSS